MSDDAFIVRHTYFDNFFCVLLRILSVSQKIVCIYFITSRSIIFIQLA